jgi:hypothetical protein
VPGHDGFKEEAKQTDQPLLIKEGSTLEVAKNECIESKDCTHSVVDDEFLGTREDHGRRGQFGDRRATLLNIGRPSIRLGIIRRRGIDHKQKAQGTQTQFRTGITRKENEPVEAAKDRHALKRKKRVNPEEDEERFQQSTMVRGWDENRTFTTLSGSRHSLCSILFCWRLHYLPDVQESAT